MSGKTRQLGEHLSYRCRCCKEWCCELAESAHAQAHECGGCFTVPDLDEPPEFPEPAHGRLSRW